MEVHDFLLGDDMDLTIVDGDFEWGESTEEHQRDILLATKGSFRQFPAMGAAIREQLYNDASYDDLRRTIQMEMERDGMTVERLQIDPQGQLKLKARYHDRT